MKVEMPSGYDNYKTGGSNPGNQWVDGPCEFCIEGESAKCPHCDGSGECGCEECLEMAMQDKADSDLDASKEDL